MLGYKTRFLSIVFLGALSALTARAETIPSTLVQVVVPTRSTRLFVEGKELVTRGVRRFYRVNTSTLDPNQTYAYQFSAEVELPRVRLRKDVFVSFKPGQAVIVSFTLVNEVEGGIALSGGYVVVPVPAYPVYGSYPTTPYAVGYYGPPPPPPPAPVGGVAVGGEVVVGGGGFASTPIIPPCSLISAVPASFFYPVLGAPWAP